MRCCSARDGRGGWTGERVGGNTKAPPKVEFGTVAATNVTVKDTTTLIATSPPHSAGVAVIKVNAPYVSSDLQGGWTSATAIAARFTYCAGACSPPVITSISPSSAPTVGGTLVTITGHGFATGIPAISFGSVRATTCGGSDTQLSVLVPPAAGGQPGQVQVTVSKLAGPSSRTAARPSYTRPILCPGLGWTTTENALTLVVQFSRGRGRVRDDGQLG